MRPDLRKIRNEPISRSLLQGRGDSFRYPDPKQIELDQANSRAFLPKLGGMRYRNSRSMPGMVRNITVSLFFGKWGNLSKPILVLVSFSWQPESR